MNTDGLVVSGDAEVINWQGRNYVPQSEAQEWASARDAALDRADEALAGEAAALRRESDAVSEADRWRASYERADRAFEAERKRARALAERCAELEAKAAVVSCFRPAAPSEGSES